MMEVTGQSGFTGIHWDSRGFTGIHEMMHSRSETFPYRAASPIPSFTLGKIVRLPIHCDDENANGSAAIGCLVLTRVRKGSPLAYFDISIVIIMQRDRTLRFWDNFYESQEPSSDKEWILQPSEPLLQRITQCLAKKSSIRILEIGCGTSSLGRELWKHMRANPSVGEEKPSVHLLATDVSETCIRQNQERDSGLLDQVLEKGSIEYKVLDITEPHPELEGKFDFILDKGCLDTFLFRSRQRGGGSQPYGKLVRSVIDNIQSWLSKEGVYVILSPRTKFKTVRDYVGFSSVERYELDPAELQKGDLVNEEGEPDCIFLYVCRKNPAYSSSTEEAFPCLHDQQQPQDEDSCQICGVAFVKFRNGEGLAGSRGAWLRRKWKGHQEHCRPKPKWPAKAC
jgi:hypothetical protein